MQPNQIPSFNLDNSLTRWLISAINNTQRPGKASVSVFKVRIIRQDGSLFLHVTFPGGHLNDEPNAPSPGSVKVTEHVLMAFRANYSSCIAEGYLDDDPEYIVYDVICFLAHAKAGVIILATESNLRGFLIEAINETKVTSPDLEYFRLHVHDNSLDKASFRVIITFHERVYDDSVGHDVPHALPSFHPHTMIPITALEEFKSMWVQAEDTLNNVNYPDVLTYSIPAFESLAK